MHCSKKRDANERPKKGTKNQPEVFLHKVFLIRSRPGKPNQRKGQNEKFMNFAHFREFWCFFLGKTSTIHISLETGIGGVKSPKIRGGVKILSFQGPLKLTPFYRVSIDNRQFGGQKSKFSRGNFRASSPPPPLAFGRF